MARSADAARANAQPTKTQLQKELSRLRARVKELERTNADLEGSNRALRDSEDRLAALVEHMPAVAFVRDLDGRFALINRAYEETYAVTNDRVCGKPLADVLPKKAARKYLDHDRRVIAAKEVVEEEIPITLDGDSHVFSSIKFPIRDATGEMIAVGGIEQDITERKKAERALEEARDAMARARARLFDAIESMSDAIVVYDADGRLEFCNNRFKAFYGYSDDETEAGVTWDDLVRIDIERGLIAGGRQGAESYYGRRAAVRGDLTSSSEVELSDGRWLHVRDRQTSTGGIVSIQADITDRKKAEHRFEALLESAPDATVIVNADGDIVQTNQQTERLFGYSAEDLLGKKVEALLPDRFRERHPAHRKQFFKDSQVRPMGVGLELYGQAKDGREFPIEISLSPIMTEDGMLVSASVRDITERKKAEEALRQGQARLDLALQATGAGVWDYDLKNGESWWSSELYSLLGYDPQELAPTYETWTSLLHPDDRERILGAEGQELDDWTTGEASRSEYRLKRKNGTFIWIEDMATATVDDSGRVLRQTGVMRDITPRKEAEQAVRESEAVLKTVLDNMPAVVFLKSADCRFRLINKRYEEVYGVCFEEIKDKTVHEIHPADLAEAFAAIDRKVIDGGEVIESEHVISSEGRDITLASALFPILDQGGAVTGFGGVEIDITDRKRAEAEIQETKERLDLALEGSGDGLWDWNVKTGEQYMDERWAGMLGFKVEELARNISTFERLIHPEDEAEVTANLEQVLASHAPSFVQDFRLRSKAGDWVWILSRGKVVEREEDGTPLRLIGTHSDITERKLAEKKLQDAYGTISESINYASNIQRSVLTEEKVLAAATREHLLLWEPRDVVGGDICWCHTWGDGTLVVLADCTGHGVPGAFMTLIATGALDRAMNEVPPGDVGQLIQCMHQMVQTTLSQESDGGDSDDGLELGACYVRPNRHRLTFAGARLPLFVVEGGDVTEVKATRQGMGYRGIPRRQAYDETQIALRDSMTFYMTSDGYLDQVGGEQRRMFGKRRFKELLLSLEDKPFADQKEALYRALRDYQGEERRRDDVSMVAFRV